MTRTNPEIRIYFSWLLYENESAYLHDIFDKSGRPLRSAESIEAAIEEYREAWAQVEGKVLPAMCDCLGLRFYKSCIDVAIAPWFRPQSDPLIIHPGFKPEEFVNVLIHELYHMLLSDNNVVQVNDHKSKVHLIDEWQKMFGEFDFPTLAHIPVHAGLKYIYLDVLGEPNRLKWDIKEAKIDPAYKAACG